MYLLIVQIFLFCNLVFKRKFMILYISDICAHMYENPYVCTNLRKCMPYVNINSNNQCNMRSA